MFLFCDAQNYTKIMYKYEKGKRDFVWCAYKKSYVSETRIIHSSNYLFINSRLTRGVPRLVCSTGDFFFENCVERKKNSNLNFLKCRLFGNSFSIYHVMDVVFPYSIGNRIQCMAYIFIFDILLILLCSLKWKS